MVGDDCAWVCAARTMLTQFADEQARDIRMK